MIFKKLTIRNFLSIGNKPFVFEFKKGITIFNGLNGSGKSTIDAAIKFVIFGDSMDKKNKAHLINWHNKKSCKVELEFEKDGSHYVLSRFIKSKSASVEISLYKDNVEQNVTSVNTSNKEIMDLFNINKKLLDQTAFLNKDFYQPFLRLSSPNKRQFIKEVFDFSVYENMEEIFKEKRKSVKGDIIKLENEFSNIDEYIKITRQQIEKEIRDKKTLLTIKNDMLNTLINKNDRILETFHEVDLNDIKEYEKEISEIKDRLNILNFQIKQFEENENTQSLKSQEIDKCELLQKELDEKLIKLTAAIKAIDIDSVIKQKNKHEEFWKNCQLIRHSTEQKLIEVNDEKKFYEETDICPTCNKPLTEDERKEMIEILSKRISDYENDISKYHIDMNLTGKKIEKCMQIEKSHNNMVEDYKELINEKNINDSKLVTLKIDSNISNVTIQKECYIEHDMLQIKLYNYEKQYEEIVTKNKENQHNEREIELNESKIKQLKDDILLIDHNIKNVDYSKINEYENQKEQISKKVDQAKFNSDLLNKLLFSVQDNGIKRFIVNNYVPVLNTLCEKYCNMIGSQFSLQFQDNGLNVIVMDRGEEKAYWQLSSGQRQRIDLVMLFVWLEFNRLKSNVTFPYLSLDEVFDSSLDQEGVDCLITILKGLSETLPFIHIITHKVENLNFADRNINVTLNGRYSNYEEV
jgi:DNA repair exonuclease SbcCD ATPase subunit